MDISNLDLEQLLAIPTAILTPEMKERIAFLQKPTQTIIRRESSKTITLARGINPLVNIADGEEIVIESVISLDKANTEFLTFTAQVKGGKCALLVRSPREWTEQRINELIGAFAPTSATKSSSTFPNPKGGSDIAWHFLEVSRP